MNAAAVKQGGNDGAVTPTQVVAGKYRWLLNPFEFKGFFVLVHHLWAVEQVGKNDKDESGKMYPSPSQCPSNGGEEFFHVGCVVSRASCGNILAVYQIIRKCASDKKSPVSKIWARGAFYIKIGHLVDFV